MERQILNFNTDWLYLKKDIKGTEAVTIDESEFECVCVPHANTILQKHKGPNFQEQIESYRFVSWYRRHFARPEYMKDNMRLFVEFEGVATLCEVYVNAHLVGIHKGAYTTFKMDITDYISDENVIAVRVDSTKHNDIPPEGGEVDYCLFGGIVRNVRLIVTGEDYIENLYLTANPDIDSTLTAKSEFVFSNDENNYESVLSVYDNDKLVCESVTRAKSCTEQKCEISDLKLWSPDRPYLYKIVLRLMKNGKCVDSYETKFGFRYFKFDKAFYLNGEKLVLRGVNRHEQWPWIGRAVVDKLQRHDADLIKESGFNAVRCSHYPQAISFLDRCDEIGLIVFEEAPGWQHIGDEAWQEVYKENLRDMIIRDRNHPSIVTWGTRVNESFDNDIFYTDTNNLAKSLDNRPTHGTRREESYADSHFLDNEDIFTAHYTYPEVPRHTPFVSTEHSWECWTNGHGCAWATNEDALDFAKSFANVVDYYYGNELCAGGFAWSMFDYDNEVNYTKTDNVFYSGVYDIFRLPKMAAYFYKSQKNPKDEAIMYIGGWSVSNSSQTITLMSNCDEAELFINGVSCGKKSPNLLMNLPHPMTEFENISFKSGTIEAVGYINGKVAAKDVRQAPSSAKKIILTPDYTTLIADGTDMTSVSVIAVDEYNQRVTSADNVVTLSIEGAAKFIGEKEIALEGGAAAFLVQANREPTTVHCSASCEGLDGGKCEIEILEFNEYTVPIK